MMRTVIRRGDRHYLVSTVRGPGGWETLVFPASADGSVSKYVEVAGERHHSESGAKRGHSRMVKSFEPPAGLSGWNPPWKI